MPIDLGRASEYIKSIDLTGTPLGMKIAEAAEADTGEIFDKAKSQAQVVGSRTGSACHHRATMNALTAMKPDSPWITLFRRESQKAKTAPFQIGLVEKEEDSDVFVSLLACLIQADQTITQVLFFKYKYPNASFKASGAKVSINGPSLIELQPLIRAKVRAYQTDYLSSILDLPINDRSAEPARPTRDNA